MNSFAPCGLALIGKNHPFFARCLSGDAVCSDHDANKTKDVLPIAAVTTMSVTAATTAD
jgi:hypothetical protein